MEKIVKKFIPITQELLLPKRGTSTEITAYLHERCNLSCSFCFSNVREDISKAFINQEKVNKIKHVMKNTKYDYSEDVTIHYMGGEIFDPDLFSFETIGVYLDMIEELNNYGYELGYKEVKHLFVTNLVIDLKPVLMLLDEIRKKDIQISITTSYDPRGRFNKATKAIWRDNLKALKERGEKVTISMIFTKPFIRLLLSEGDETFKELYDEGYEIYIDYFTPTTTYTQNQALLQTNLPSDIDLLKAFVYLVDNFPNVSPISGMITRNPLLSCKRNELCSSTTDWGKCGHQSLNSSTIGFYKSNIQSNDNTEIETRFMLENNCLSCNHFSYCQMGCFMQHDFSKRTQLKDCLYNLTYNYIRDRKPIDFDKLETYFGKKEL